jgi:uncharacterized protein
MKILIQHIPTQGTTLAYSKEVKEFPVLKTVMEEGECRFLGPMTIELTVLPEQDLFKVSGLIGADIQLACSRCLAEFESRMTRRFTLRFSRAIPEGLHSDGEPEVELTADQIGLTFFKGDEIDFKDVVQEQVVLGLPYKPLCREECKGLCPRCGTDLNVESCGCSNARSSSPFAVLKNLEWRSRNQEKK